MAFVRKPVRAIKLADVQAYADSLNGLAPATRSRAIAVAKSLLGFAHRLGYTSFNVAGPVRVPSAKDARSERILPEAAVQRMLALEPNGRNRVLLRLLYASRVRVSELCGLRQRDLQAREDRGQVTVFGKGRETRTVLLPASLWKDLETLRTEGDGPDAPAFRSRKEGGAPISPGSSDPRPQTEKSPGPKTPGQNNGN